MLKEKGKGKCQLVATSNYCSKKKSIIEHVYNIQQHQRMQKNQIISTQTWNIPYSHPTLKNLSLVQKIKMKFLTHLIA